MIALLENGKSDALPAVSRWLHYAEGTRRVAEVTTFDRSPEERLETIIRQNVLVQLDHLRTHPSVAAKLAQGTLRLHGWLYDIGSGDVSAYQPERRKFVSLAREESEVRS
jgi:carbonic anhydrase